MPHSNHHFCSCILAVVGKCRPCEALKIKEGRKRKMQIPEIIHYFKVLVAKEVDDQVETTGDDMEDGVYATKEEAVAVADKEALDPTCISAIVIEHKDFPIYEIRKGRLNKDVSGPIQ